MVGYISLYSSSLIFHLGLHVGPVSKKKSPGTLVEYSANVLSAQIVQSTRYASIEMKETVKMWLSDLPGATRTSIMQHLFQYKQKPNKDSESKVTDLTRYTFPKYKKSSIELIILDQNTSMYWNQVFQSFTVWIGLK